MSKKKKTFTVEELNDSVIEGMALCHEVFYNEVDRLRQSLDDVMCLYMEEDGNENAGRVASLQVAYDALTLLRDRFQDSYFEKIDSVKAQWEGLKMAFIFEKDSERINYITNMLSKNPYTTPDGEVLSGEEGAIRFIELFFPEEFDNE